MISRRRLLSTGAALAATTVVAGCGGRHMDRSGEGAAAEVPTASPGGFPEPVELRSVDGHLEVSLSATPRTGVADGLLAYNGGPIGPTLRVRPGDSIAIDFDNQLDEATNLHTHGLLVSPSGRGDNVFVSIPPGERRRYEYELPADHPIGTYWYHPHLHGSVARQTAAGLVGAIVVEPKDESSPFGTVVERTWVLNDPVPFSVGRSHMVEMHGRAGSEVAVNGVAAPRFGVISAGRELWRVINASASRRLPFGIDGVAIDVIGLDGHLLATPRTVDGVVLSPGERADVVVKIPDRDEISIFGDVDGGPLAVATPTENTDNTASTGPVEVTPTSTTRLSADDVTRTRTLRFGAGGGMMSGGLEFTIDGRTFDPDRVDIATSIGEIEEWTIVNDTAIDHPFHLHVWPFQPVDGPDAGAWKDTINVAGGESVSIRIAFSERPGRSVFHCHVLDHEDLGMMGVIEVAPK